MIDYNNKTFAAEANSTNGEVSSQTLFHYRQEGNLVWADYAGGEIVKGHLIATADESGNLDMAYHHVNDRGEVRTGKCLSRPETLPNGKLRLHERWQWTNGDLSKGESTLIEE